MQPEEKLALKLKVEQAIDSIRPYMEADGGNITVDEITDDLVAMVRLHGACS
jgi:Fe-S cluster biogenesis protein NfuA